MDYSYNRTKVAAVDKVPIFGKFEVKLTLDKIERMVAQHYGIIPGTCKLQPGIEGYANQGRIHINFTVDLAPSDKNYDEMLRLYPKDTPVTTGSVIIAIENNSTSVRAYAFVNVDS